MKIVFATPYRKSSNDREKNTYLFIEYYNKLPLSISKEVLVVEQDSVQTLVPNNFKYIYAYNPSLFNRSWGFNLAIKNTDADLVCYIDNDIFIPIPFLEDAIQRFKQFHFVKPFSCNLLYDVTYPSCSHYVRTGNPPEKLKARAGLNWSSAAFIMKREWALALKGMDERFQGWGGEDDAFTYKVQCLIGGYEVNGYAFHICHDRGVLDTNQQPQYQNNLKILREEYLGRGSQRMQEMVNNINLEAIGSLRKFK